MLFRRTFSTSIPLLRIVAKNKKYLIKTCGERNQYIAKDKMFDAEKKIVLRDYKYTFAKNNKQITLYNTPINQKQALLKYADWLHTGEPSIAANVQYCNTDGEYNTLFEKIGVHITAVKEEPLSPFDYIPFILGFVKYFTIIIVAGFTLFLLKNPTSAIFILFIGCICLFIFLN